MARDDGVESEGYAPPAPREQPEYGETWVYENIVEAVPGIDLPERTAVAVQFLGFEAVALVLAAVYGDWAAVPAATAAIAVAAAGSLMMQYMARRIRQADAPDAYTAAVLGSSIDVVLGMLAFVGLLTYLFVLDPRNAVVGGVALRTAEEPLVTALLGESPPVPAVYLTLLVLWDLCYRIGTGWWAAVVGVWRSWRYTFDGEAAAALRSVDLLNLGFGLLQLALLPFLWGHRLLFVAVLGHVLAVVAVVAAALVLLEK